MNLDFNVLENIIEKAKDVFEKQVEEMKKSPIKTTIKLVIIVWAIAKIWEVLSKKN